MRKSVLAVSIALFLISMNSVALSPAIPMMSGCTIAVMTYRGYVNSYLQCMSALGVLQPELCYGFKALAKEALENVALYCDFSS